MVIANDGVVGTEVAAHLGVTRATVSKWRRRFAERRLEGLCDEPRPGVARSIADEMVEAPIVKTLEETPKDATHWSTRSMAKTTGMSQSAVSRIWRAFGLKPHLTETLELSADPQFVDKVRDIVGLYLNPPDAALVLCMVHDSEEVPIAETVRHIDARQRSSRRAARVDRDLSPCDRTRFT